MKRLQVYSHMYYAIKHIYTTYFKMKRLLFQSHVIIPGIYTSYINMKTLQVHSHM